jgi:hypothetical protein
MISARSNSNILIAQTVETRTEKIIELKILPVQLSLDENYKFRYINSWDMLSF